MVTTPPQQGSLAWASERSHPGCRRPITFSKPSSDFARMGRFQEYQVVGRKLPSEKDANPKLYRMRIFAPNDVVAKSRFWYYLRQLRKAKKASGEIVGLNVIHEKKPLKVKNFGIWLRYDSRSGTHNMYKEFRELSRVDAAQACYQDMASRHRARFRSIQILRIAEIEKASDVRRPNIKQLLVPKLRFPLPHRVVKYRSKFLATRPSTFY
ncbi:60S ribosomal protein L20 [Puccinia graminis f. sp. tritici]|uniref:60S ribosomal protein L20 n=2 Tax=Puccinia graminis f. sp. tritici TaxID=56615 RepID=A0A5B0PAL6_PUCGR|nr:60S ribosomal protein L20 [Puccinia graminis f. sp. tritici]KAA1125645.1 60S ribosomal protein L20 [Puccinia graminis f. sp. tritici]